MQAGIIFLLLNRHKFIDLVDDRLLTNFTLAVASAEHTLESVQDWLKNHIQPIA